MPLGHQPANADVRPCEPNGRFRGWSRWSRPSRSCSACSASPAAGQATQRDAEGDRDRGHRHRDPHRGDRRRRQPVRSRTSSPAPATRCRASAGTSTRAAPPRTSAWRVASSSSTSTTRTWTRTRPATPRSRPAPTTSPWSEPRALLLDERRRHAQLQGPGRRDDGHPRHPVRRRARSSNSAPTSRSRSSRPALRCATKDQHPQTYDANVARGYYFTKKYGDLHGIYVFSHRLEKRIRRRVRRRWRPQAIPARERGIHSDGDFAVSALAQQSRVHPDHPDDEDQELELRAVRAAVRVHR